MFLVPLKAFGVRVDTPSELVRGGRNANAESHNAKRRSSE
ncbi:hypothetical protein C731_3989 [Mycolicibacterium hassiacum DSM 44199]|uniref:Uncharacterized protein n=1 Tax=Mycolicibacterium hassiacum (strain DSM 44199 / CIP 105218 / JCM 12690 / 3849) TaxID=1122247 RepID=K5BAC6_MYCHD|nr:hypothetical protein C731_3989 [Mycolicibacterium hassiacum DSM 44199]